MKNQSDNSYSKWLFLALPVLWIGAGLASGYEDGMTAFEVLRSEEHTSELQSPWN